MKIEPMSTTPETRAEFERNIHILRERLRDGNIAIRRDLKLTQSLVQLRYLPNKRMNLLSIDERARLLANTIAKE